MKSLFTVICILSIPKKMILSHILFDLPELKLFTICPDMFMILTVLVLLHTTNCSVLRGSKCTLGILVSKCTLEILVSKCTLKILVSKCTLKILVTYFFVTSSLFQSVSLRQS